MDFASCWWFHCIQILSLNVKLNTDADLVPEWRCIATASDARCSGWMPILGSGGPGNGGMYLETVLSTGNWGCANVYLNFVNYRLLNVLLTCICKAFMWTQRFDRTWFLCLSRLTTSIYSKFIGVILGSRRWRILLWRSNVKILSVSPAYSSNAWDGLELWYVWSIRSRCWRPKPG